MAKRSLKTSSRLVEGVAFASTNKIVLEAIEHSHKLFADDNIAELGIEDDIQRE